VSPRLTWYYRSGNRIEIHHSVEVRYGNNRQFGPRLTWNNTWRSSLTRVVEEGAVAAARTMGQGDRKGSDQAAVQAMRRAFESVPIAGNIVIGEGERDEAPMLYIGEAVGAPPTQGVEYPAVEHRRGSTRRYKSVCHRRGKFHRGIGGIGSGRLLHRRD